jgi:hypothetical protein
MKIFTVANVPDDLQQEWLQHLRDFDVAHPGCHFEVAMDAPDEPLSSMVDRLVINPDLTFVKLYERTKWKKP